MLTTDITNRTLIITRPIIFQDRMSSAMAHSFVKRQERLSKMKPGIRYTLALLKVYRNQTKFVSGGKVWKIVVREPGEGFQILKEKTHGTRRPSRSRTKSKNRKRT